MINLIRMQNLYIQLFSIHGLVRGTNVEMGRNADTGGQVKYVLELARALGEREEVRKVDLFTRLIREKTFSTAYSRPIEKLSNKTRIIRIQCGGGKYIRKELLWPHLDEYIDRVLKFIKDENDIPDIIHGHYADAGYVGKELATLLGAPLVFTGHSLGRIKKQRLLEDGLKEEEIEKQYHIEQRIHAEEEILGMADKIIASTHQEVEEQYAFYESSPSTDFQVIPPGIDLSRFFPFFDETFTDIEAVEERDNIKQAQFYMQKELERFLSNPEKPFILALSRPDRNKNITGLISAYGMDKELQAISNLAVFAGIRKDITNKDENERQVLTELLLLMDKYDLYGKLAIPKRHDFEYEVPELYRMAARSQGVFVNPSFNENFGLTLIEAAASGLPIVATDDGGPQDIIHNCQNGILVDVTNHEAIASALKKILINAELWKEYSQNGVQYARSHYSWQTHCRQYLDQAQNLPLQIQAEEQPPDRGTVGKRLTKLKKLFITDIDDTLIGNDEALNELLRLIEDNRDRIGFGVATGRDIDSVIEVIEAYNLSHPDIIISSVGTEIYYGPKLLPDKGWRTHISARWDRSGIKTILDGLKFLSPQEERAQRKYKLSYYIENPEENLAHIHYLLTRNRLRYNIIYSGGRFLDILPYKASKGKAVRYLHYKWNVPLSNILVSGDSGNDEEMLRGELLGVVVGNYSPELDQLRGQRHIYFAKKTHAAGILEGFKQYAFDSEN